MDLLGHVDDAEAITVKREETDETLWGELPPIEEASDESDWNDPDLLPVRPRLVAESFDGLEMRIAEFRARMDEVRYRRDQTQAQQQAAVNVRLDNAFAQSRLVQIVSPELLESCKEEIKQLYWDQVVNGVTEPIADLSNYPLGDLLGARERSGRRETPAPRPDRDTAMRDGSASRADAVRSPAPGDEDVSMGGTANERATAPQPESPSKKRRALEKVRSVIGIRRRASTQLTPELSLEAEMARPLSSLTMRSRVSQRSDVPSHAMMPGYFVDPNLPPGSEGGPPALPEISPNPQPARPVAKMPRTKPAKKVMMPGEIFAWDEENSFYTSVDQLEGLAVAKMAEAFDELKSNRDRLLGYLNKSRREDEAVLDGVCTRCRVTGHAKHCSNKITEDSPEKHVACDTCVRLGGKICGTVIGHPGEPGEYAIGFHPIPAELRSRFRWENDRSWYTVSEELNVASQVRNAVSNAMTSLTAGTRRSTREPKPTEKAAGLKK